MDNTVHQLLHGYRRGHELLAGSTRLARPAADLVRRLSDLSGPAGAGLRVAPYITCYPLPESDYYALALTIPDKDAERKGCVLTHTILIPIPLWSRAPSPCRFRELLVAPNRAGTDDFMTPVATEAGQGATAEAEDAPATVPSHADEFARAFFGEIGRPVVWLGEDAASAERLLWRVVAALWSEVRASFAFCSFSLQPRQLQDRPFDLEFAPISARSRFLRLDNAWVIPRGAKEEPSPNDWTVRCAKQLFGSKDRPELPPHVWAARQHLDDDPSSLRLLFRLDDLANRIPSSPTAAAGAMDILHMIASDPESAVDLKRSIIESGIAASRELQPVPRLEALRLIGDRLSIHSFERVAKHADVRDAAREAVLRAPLTALRSLDVQTHLAIARTPYSDAVLGILRDLGNESPATLCILADLPDLAPWLVRAEPSLGAAYLRATEDVGSTERRALLVDWISRLGGDLEAERTALIPHLVDGRDAPLLSELLRNVSVGQARSLLTAIDEHDPLSHDAELRRVLCETLRPAMDAVESWAATAPCWDKSRAALVAECLPASHESLTHIVSMKLSDDRRADVCAEFLLAHDIARHPAWLTRVAQDDRFLAAALEFGMSDHPRLAGAMADIMSTDIMVSGTLLPDLREAIARSSDERLHNALISVGVRSALHALAQNELTPNEESAWNSAAWAQNWYCQASAETVLHSLVPTHRRSPETSANVWRWVANAPEPVYQRTDDFTCRVLDGLLGAARFNWHNDIAHHWPRILERSRTGSASVHLRLSVQALSYCFANENRPLGPVIAIAFETVYRAVTTPPYDPPETIELFGYLDWDKGKELRRRLITAFLRSCWSPAFLALAAATDQQALRRIIRRVQRSWGGSSYVSRMIDDLGARGHGDLANRVSAIAYR